MEHLLTVDIDVSNLLYTAYVVDIGGEPCGSW